MLPSAGLHDAVSVPPTAISQRAGFRYVPRSFLANDLCMRLKKSMNSSDIVSIRFLEKCEFFILVHGVLRGGVP